MTTRSFCHTYTNVSIRLTSGLEFQARKYGHTKEVTNALDIERMAAHDGPVTVGLLLAEAAARKGVSHEEAGHAIGVSQATFSRWASGENVPASRYWAKIARFLGVSRDRVAEIVAAERLARGSTGREDRINVLERKVDRLAGLVEQLLDR